MGFLRAEVPDKHEASHNPSQSLFMFGTAWDPFFY